jgi:hypothetical protein
MGVHPPVTRDDQLAHHLVPAPKVTSLIRPPHCRDLTTRRRLGHLTYSLRCTERMCVFLR